MDEVVTIEFSSFGCVAVTYGMIRALKVVPVKVVVICIGMNVGMCCDPCSRPCRDLVDILFKNN